MHTQRRIHLFGRHVALPQSRATRISMGSGLVVMGCLGFLPVLGFWMIPLGLLILSHDIARVRRWRRRSAVWWQRRRQRQRQRQSQSDGQR